MNFTKQTNKQTKNHDLQKPPGLRQQRWGRNSKRDKTQTIHLKGDKPGECSVLDLKWSMSKRNDWWTMWKPDYSSKKKTGDDDSLLDNNDKILMMLITPMAYEFPISFIKNTGLIFKNNYPSSSL